MAETHDFKAWEDECAVVDWRKSDEERYVQTMPLRRPGKWDELERELRHMEPDELDSLNIARSIQLVASMVPPGYRLDELMKSQAEIDQAALDVRGKRAIVGMQDGSFSGTVGGYSIMAEDEVVALRLHEVSRGVNHIAGRDVERGARFVQPLYVPVLAVCSFMLLSRS